MFKCKECNKEFKTHQALNAHVGWHKNPKRPCNYNCKVSKGPFICSICNKEYNTKGALSSHIGWHNKPGRPSNFIEYTRKVKSGEIKGSNQYIKADTLGLPKPIVSVETRRKISEGSKKQVWSDERRKNMSESMRKAVNDHPESYSQGKVKKNIKVYDYNGFKLTGTWELDFAKYLDKIGVKWTNKISKVINYTFEDKLRRYFPDFYLPELDLYIEVKGQEVERDYLKWKATPNLMVIKYPEILTIRKGGDIKIEVNNPCL